MPGPLDRLIAKHKTYCRALESIKHSVEHDKLPKTDLDEKFRQELVKCK